VQHEWGGSAMNSDPIPIRRHTITVRPSAVEKERFAALASQHGLSESELVLSALRLLIGTCRPIEPPAPRVTTAPAVDCLTIRLRPDNRQALRERARPRGMPDSSYLAALVCAHLSGNPPLPTAELEYLKQRLGTLGSHYEYLVRLTRPDMPAKLTTPQLPQELRDTAAAVKDVRCQLSEFIRAALISWESPDDG
jgi:hypothetical protein